MKKMKKHLFILFLATIAITAFGQISIPNGNFETWNSVTYDYPQNYPYTSNTQSFFQYQLPFNITKTTDSYHGQYAVQLVTNASATDTNFAYFVNTNANGGPSSWTGGIPYNQMPTGIRGWYKYNVATADSATIIVMFRNSGNNIGTYYFNIGGIQKTYTLFNFTFNPPLTMAPDSIIFAAAAIKINASNANQQAHGLPGDTLKLDSISFTGVNSQPDMLNGDFESWQSQTLNTPANWYSQSYGNGDFINKTTDFYKGKNAIELITYLGNQHNLPAAQPSEISTGYYSNNCNNNCIEKGGFPFSNQTDTLIFYYKYAPSGNDSAQINLNFKLNGSQFENRNIFIHASATYDSIVFPFSLSQAPDSVMIDIQSSAWQDTLLSFVGSDLKIDEMHFKSQPLTTGIFKYENNNAISIFPNPTSDKLFIETNNLKTSIYNLEILNTTGQVVLAKQITNSIEQVDLSGQAAGVYFVKLQSVNNSVVRKIVKQN